MPIPAKHLPDPPRLLRDWKQTNDQATRRHRTNRASLALFRQTARFSARQTPQHSELCRAPHTDIRAIVNSDAAQTRAVFAKHIEKTTLRPTAEHLVASGTWNFVEFGSTGGAGGSGSTDRRNRSARARRHVKEVQGPRTRAQRWFLGLRVKFPRPSSFMRSGTQFGDYQTCYRLIWYQVHMLRKLVKRTNAENCMTS